MTTPEIGRPGLLIVVDGMDGSGKGTVISSLVDSVTALVGSHKLVVTKEPGGTPVGNSVREVLFSKHNTSEMEPGVSDCLFLASHLQNWQQLVRPALLDKKVVISDRWPYSQGAYAKERHVPLSVEFAYNQASGNYADLFILLHGDPETLYKRANSRTTEIHQAGKVWNNIATLERIQGHYLSLYRNRPEFWPIYDVDAKSPSQVVKEATDKVVSEIRRKQLDGLL